MFRPETAYRKHFQTFLAKKHKMAVDAWGKDDTHVKQIYEPIISLIQDSVEDKANLKLYPPLWTVPERTTRISRTMLVAEFLVKEWADLFIGMDNSWKRWQRVSPLTIATRGTVSMIS
ncbi:hypothetical protein BKA70DRAFT_668650 [Coprinopsis sp. MPI-PUGE-AT-0042]|nr:hypothetical protein BKA70DRAFT_668650 [Coprinopsis sp. MPI-PUGE-AT-0042]